MTDRRRHLRTEASLRLKLTHPEIGSIVCTTQDISDSGAYLLSDNSEALPIGTVVTVQVQDAPQNVPVLYMRVVRHGSDGIGLEFIDPANLQSK
ncbi:MAG TPA: PilZ domain-containing protein [Gammaproteobacteria bacterium]|nr:PilZ domain-containing protein [Gammaproteobacteria bacterium]